MDDDHRLEDQVREQGMKLARLEGEMRVLLERSHRQEQRLDQHGEALGYSKGWQELVAQGLRDLRKTVDKHLLRTARGKHPQVQPPAAGADPTPTPPAPGC